MSEQSQPVDDLGEKLGYFGKAGLVVGIVGTAVGMPLLFVGSQAVFGGTSSPFHTFARESVGLAVLTCLVGAVLGPASFVTLIIALIRPFKSVTLYEKGFVHETRNEALVFRWTEIAQVTQRAFIVSGGVNRFRFTVVRKDGREVVYNRSVVNNYIKLGRHIMQAFMESNLTDTTYETNSWGEDEVIRLRELPASAASSG